MEFVDLSKEERGPIVKFTKDQADHVVVIGEAIVENDRAMALELYNDMLEAQTYWKKRAGTAIMRKGKITERGERLSEHTQELAQLRVDIVTGAIEKVEKTLKAKGWL